MGSIINTLVLQEAYPRILPDLHLNEATATAPALIKDSNFTPTSQETLSSTIFTSFIAKYAELKGHKAVVFCESATKLAAKTLQAISKGQGWNLGELVGGSDIPIAGSSKWRTLKVPCQV